MYYLILKLNKTKKNENFINKSNDFLIGLELTAIRLVTSLKFLKKPT